MQRRILIILLAGALAMLSGLAVLAYASSADERAVQGTKSVRVLLATGTIPADTTGADIKAKKLVRSVVMPARAVPDDAVLTIDSTIAGMALNAPLQTDQMLLRGQFRPAGPATPSPTPTFVLPKGLVAVSFDVGMAPQVAGHVDQNATVCVYNAWRDRAGEWHTALLLPSAKVIAIGEKPTQTIVVPVVPSVSPSPGASVTPAASPTPVAVTASSENIERYVVTLAVTRDDGEKLVLGYNKGNLHLGLVSLPPTTPTPRTAP